jgi:hypothetical protein
MTGRGFAAALSRSETLKILTMKSLRFQGMDTPNTPDWPRETSTRHGIQPSTTQT